jgi:two-component system sensor histidine kinase BarA
MFNLKTELNDEKNRFSKKIEKNNIIIKNTLEESMWMLNEEIIRKNIDFFLEDSEIIRIKVYDNFIHIDVGDDKNFINKIKQKFVLKKENIVIGNLEIIYSNDARLNEIQEKTKFIYRFMYFLIILIFFINYAILKYINKPINDLLYGLKEVEKGNLDIAINVKSNDEYKIIANRFNKMVRTLKLDRKNILTKEKQLKIAKNEAIAYSEELKKLNEELENIIVKRTEQLEKERKKAVEANSAKDRFLANISHEMRTPLTPIIGFTKNLITNIKDAEVVKKLKIIKEAGEKLLNLTDELLKFVKLDKYEINIEKEEINLREFFNNIYEFTKNRAEVKNLKYEINLDENLPEIIYFDNMKLYEIVINIIQNAIKYTDKGFVLVEIAYENNSLIFDVYDSGIGIPKEKLEHIFEAFEQVNIQSEGIGLGLNIVKRFVKSLNGKINIDSFVGKGTHLNIVLPIEKNENIIKNSLMKKIDSIEQVEKKILTLKALIKIPLRLEKLYEYIENGEIESFNKEIHSLKGVTGNYKFDELYEIVLKIEKINKNEINVLKEYLKRIKNIIATIDFKKILLELIKNREIKILIAEDLEENRELLKLLLDSKSFNVDYVNDGEEAYEKYSKNKYDLLLLDIQMPKLTGIEVVEKIRKNEIENKNKILALTAHGFIKNIKEYKRIGFDDFISKPIDEIILYSKIYEYIK